MQSDAWYAFATDDLRVMDRSPELLGDTAYLRRWIALNETGHCRACSRRTVVVEKA